MPKIAEIKIIEGDVWCKVELERSTDVTQPITLWTPDEITEHDRKLLISFHADLIDKYIKGDN